MKNGHADDCAAVFMSGLFFVRRSLIVRNVYKADIEAQIRIRGDCTEVLRAVGNTVGKDYFCSIAAAHVAQRHRPALDGIVEPGAEYSGSR